MESTNATLTEQETTMYVADATTEWLSFFLMTIGWFILLTSMLGFWRVKRWERGILASHQDTNHSSTQEQQPRDSVLMGPIGQMFGLSGVSRNDLFRGFGLGLDNEEGHRLADMEEGIVGDVREMELMIPFDPNEPNHSTIQALVNDERRLQQSLRAAGIL